MAKTLLAVRGLYKAFGGIQTAHDLNLYVDEGELVAVIGANGAGKSTLFNMLSGYLRPDEGEVFLSERRITGKSPQALVKLGMGRSFQQANVFLRLSVYENVQTAVLAHLGQARNLWRKLHGWHEVDEATERILQDTGLGGMAQRLAGELSLGDQKRLEVGLVLASKPKLMLLDEPTAGMSPEETAQTVTLIQQLAQSYGMSLLFTEHDMKVVFGVAQRIYVLHQGRIIAEGTPESIAHNPQVQAVYLGQEETG